VMSHDAGMIRLEVYDFILASTGGPNARTLVSYSPCAPHLPGVVRPSALKKERLSALVGPFLPRRLAAWTAGNTESVSGGEEKGKNTRPY